MCEEGKRKKGIHSSSFTSGRHDRDPTCKSRKILRDCSMLASALLGLVSAFVPDDYLSFTTRSSLVANSKRVAWIETTRGCSNIYGCELPACMPRALTTYSESDGISLGGLTLMGEALLFTRSEAAGANPMSVVAPVDLATYALAWPASAPSPPAPQEPVLIAPHALRATTGGQATFATSASGHLTLSEANVTDLILHGRRDGAKLMPLIRTAGSLAEPCSGNPPIAWSADGQLLAISIQRLDHSAVAVWRRGWRRLAWVAPSMDFDRCPVWSPSGASLAFVRFRGASSVAASWLPTEPEPSGIAGWLHQAPSFSIMVVDARRWRQHGASNHGPPGGQVAAREVFRESKDGSYPGTGDSGYGERPLAWVALSHWSAASAAATTNIKPEAREELLIGSEASGFVHVLAVDASGDVSIGTNRSHDLTPVPCEHQGWVAGGNFLFVAHSCEFNLDALLISRIDMRTSLRQPVGTHDAYRYRNVEGQGSR